jgi:hypothetical protein
VELADRRLAPLLDSITPAQLTLATHGKPEPLVLPDASEAVCDPSAEPLAAWRAHATATTAESPFSLGQRGVPPPSCMVISEGRFQELSRLDPSIVALGDHFVARIRRACGEERVVVPAEALVRGGGGAGYGGFRTPKVWVRAEAPITWEDGSAAGKTTHVVAHDEDAATFAGDRVCFRVPPFVSKLCAAKADVETSTSLPPAWKSP